MLNSIKTNPVNFMITCDNNYAKYMINMLIEIMEKSNRHRQYKLYYFNENISDIIVDALNTIKSRYSNFDYVVKVPVIDINYNGRYTKNTTVRLNITKELEGENVSKILYLDADLFILDDIAKLFDTDISNCAVGVVRDYLVHKYIKKDKDTCLEESFPKYKWKKYAKEILGITNPKKYFNAGVMLMNLDRLKELNLSEQMITFINDVQPALVDQDAYNKFLPSNEIKYLDYSWNINWLFADTCRILYNKPFYHRAYYKPKIMHGHWWEYVASARLNKKQLAFYHKCVEMNPLTSVKLIIHGPFAGNWISKISKQMDKFKYNFSEIILVMYEQDSALYEQVLEPLKKYNLKVIKVKDPENPGFANINRQLVQMNAALSFVDDDDYVFKLRNDQSIDFNKVWEHFSDDKIVTTNCYSRKDRPFHPSDMFLFAKGKLLKEYYDMPLMTETSDEVIEENLRLCNKFALKYIPYAPESILCRNYLEKKDSGCTQYAFSSKGLIKKYFVVLNSWNIDYRWIKSRTPYTRSGSIILPYYFDIAPFKDAPVEIARNYTQAEITGTKSTLKDIYYLAKSRLLFGIKYHNCKKKKNKK